ncbi:hypothetical protein ACP87_02425 [Pseudomonas oleovorans]|nr:hypothetical protein [Pseudomonas oleovorans]MBN7131090.1 hypothetical protein [Pseudomonas oleovorans]
MQRLQGIGILLLTTEAILLRTILGEGAHQPAALEGVLQAVEEHVVGHLTMAHAITTTGTRQQIRRVGHALHAAGHQHFAATGQQLVMAEHQRLHAGATHLVQRGALHRLAQPCAQRRLARRCLALAGLQHAAHQHRVHRLGRKPGALRVERMAAAPSSAAPRVCRRENHPWGAGGADDDNGIELLIHEFHLQLRTPDALREISAGAPRMKSWPPL